MDAQMSAHAAVYQLYIADYFEAVLNPKVIKAHHHCNGMAQANEQFGFWKEFSQ
jgi:hypothetical protein